MAAPPPRVKVKNAIVSLLLVAALVITGALAFLTAKDSAENKFTVGNVDISLTEPLWDAANPDGTLENIVAGQVITKDPTITNTGVNNAYVYFQVEIPKVYKTDITGADDTATEMTDYPLFTMQTKNGDTATDLVAFDAEGKPYSTNEDFVIVDSFIDDTLTYAYDYYLFAYVGETEPEDTVKLFDQIQFANITDKFENLANGTTDAEGNTTFPAITNLQVNVKAYAIQSDFYNNEAGEEKSAENAWSLYVNQNDWKWEPVNYEG
ncbi:MAG: SipW-dependent-type signal peptide-containing protein, partial [Clostridia bacterium]|nr:SipW-dependent-type signal peptide-containing protein [Clostridia bacterium]